MSPTALPSTSPSRCPSPERGSTSAHQSGSPMRKAIAGRDQHRRRLRLEDQRIVDAGVQIETGRETRPHDGNPQPESRGSRICSSILTGSSLRPQVLSDALGEAGGDLALGHDRPVLDAVARRPGGSCCWSPPKVPVPGETSLARIQSQRLRARLARALATMSSVSAAKPMTSAGRSLARCGDARRGCRGFRRGAAAAGPCRPF